MRSSHTASGSRIVSGAVHGSDLSGLEPALRDYLHRYAPGIDEQVAKAEKAVAGKTPVKRNRFVQLDGGTKSVNRELEAKAREPRDQ